MKPSSAARGLLGHCRKDHKVARETARDEGQCRTYTSEQAPTSTGEASGNSYCYIGPTCTMIASTLFACSLTLLQFVLSCLASGYLLPSYDSEKHYGFTIMSVQTNVSLKPSKDIDEFLQRHPEVRVGEQARAELEHLHNTGDTSCLESKIFDNVILHQDYDGDSNQRVLAVAIIDDSMALARYEEIHGDVSDACNCKTGAEEGPDHYLHESMVVAKEPTCEVHKGEDAPNPDCSACWPFWSGSNCQR